MGNMERILRLMAEKNASDVFISANAPILIKISGNSVPVNPQLMSADTCLVLLRELLSESQMQELMYSGEMNSSFTLQGIGNYRISAMRQRGTYAAAIRYIPMAIPNLESLGLPTKVLSELIMRQRGLVLVVGSTGSGKSTSLAAMLDLRNTRTSGHILTIEEPIEFVFTNKRSIVNQREVGSDTVDRDIALKNAMRQAPDVILIGEIRDRDTMAAALAYAQSGHLCLSTLHASNSYQALNRILNFYPEEVRPSLLGDLSSGMAAIISQRLLRTVDGKRLPACEVLLNSRLISELIEQGDFTGVRDAMNKSMTEGSQTFEEDIARLILDGKIGRQEGMSFADSPTNLMWRLQNTQPTQKFEIDESGEGQEPSFSEITLDMKR